MRTAILTGLMAFFYLAAANDLRAAGQDPFKGRFTLVVDGTALQSRPKMMILRYKRAGAGLYRDVRDTVMVKGSRVVFTGFVDEPLSAEVFALTGSSLFNGVQFFLEPGQTRIITGATLPGAKIVAGPFQRALDTLSAERLRYEKMYPLVLSDAEMKVTSVDEQAYMQLDAKREHWRNVMLDSVYSPFVARHAGSSAAALYALEQYAGQEDLLIRSSALHVTDSLFRLLASSFQGLSRAIALRARIDKALSVSVGRMAPELVQPDTAGRMLSLSSFRGRYVLVDFWASWCHWCRAENPNLIAAYGRYHPRNFEILQVSLDSKFYKDAWLKAIVKDHTGIWPQVCELSDTNTAAELYGVHAIPQDFLIDPAGKIIAVNLRGDSLNAMLAEIFDGQGQTGAADGIPQAALKGLTSAGIYAAGYGRQDHIGAWTNVSDLLTFRSEVLALYGIHSIPRNFLVDPTGRVVAKDLRGGDIERVLEKIPGN